MTFALIVAMAFGAGDGAWQHGDTGSPCSGTFEVHAATYDYGADHAFQALDLYAPRIPGPTSPPGATPRHPPLAIYVHGGAWVSRDKSEYENLGRAFARCGIVAAIVNYRLAPRVNVVQQVDDLVDAQSWLIRQAPQPGFDPKRIYLIGHSAGAQLALYATMAGKLPRGSVAGIVAIGSVGLNPSSDAAELDPRYRDLYEPAFGADRAAWRSFDIERFLRGTEPPVLVIHGADDVMAPESISRRLYESLKKAGDRVEYIQPAGRGHWDLLESMARPDDPTMLAVERFVLGK